eukprot:CAMPEP_0178672250 /NCGR_PEP_ID=MMETSP0698-20121128/33624_1 /TAXON_ID=265572 /ORGANISM="Extubocellulus spinifer, Strain CCMP396" /LENGTH=106 /DNA_ID=CAMNT_0020316093 /DNA_START=384 /DNA_END=703 /DNA_ORIENTATION=-
MTLLAPNSDAAARDANDEPSFELNAAPMVGTSVTGIDSAMAANRLDAKRDKFSGLAHGEPPFGDDGDRGRRLPAAALAASTGADTAASAAAAKVVLLDMTSCSSSP